MTLPEGNTLRKILQYCEYPARNFRMGTIPVWYDDTQAAINDSTTFSRKGDITSIHVEGVPWQEMLDEDPFPSDFVETLNILKQTISTTKPVYLEISPGRGGANPLSVLSLKKDRKSVV